MSHLESSVAQWFDISGGETTSFYKNCESEEGPRMVWLKFGNGGGRDNDSSQNY